MYDAFVMYSSEDELYVQQVFAGELELGPYQYRLCLYHRDVAPSHFVADSIIQVILYSLKSKILVSKYLARIQLERADIF